MQKTENLSLSLMEPHDTLDPAPINANFRALETAVAAATADLGAAYHNCRIAWGTFTGSGEGTDNGPLLFTFDFTPMILFLYNNTIIGNCYPQFFMRGAPAGSEAFSAEWGDNWMSIDANGSDALNRQTLHAYLCLGYGPAESESLDDGNPTVAS